MAIMTAKAKPGKGRLCLLYSLDKVGQWNKYARFSGGTLVEKCCHYYDLLNLFAAATPERVYANGVRASFTLNMLAPHFYEEPVVSDCYRDRLSASRCGS